jgi:hypothetical protein
MQFASIVTLLAVAIATAAAPQTTPAVVFLPDQSAPQYPTWELLTSTNTTTSPSIEIVKTLGMYLPIN